MEVFRSTWEAILAPAGRVQLVNSPTERLTLRRADLNGPKSEFTEAAGSQINEDLFDLGVLSFSSGESLSLWATAADASPRMRRSNSGELAWPTHSGWTQNHMRIDRPGRVGKNGREVKMPRFKSAISKP